VSHNNKQEKTHKPKTRTSFGRQKKRKGMSETDRPCLEPNTGGIDIGAREIFVAVPPDRDECPVRVFDTFTEDLHAMARWLKACGVTTVAMESTGVKLRLSRTAEKFTGLSQLFSDWREFYGDSRVEGNNARPACIFGLSN
jgi:hypothetical protein